MIVNKSRMEKEMSAKKILLVDDDENILTVLKMRLELMGLQVTSCDNPIDAIEIFKQGDFDLVLTDQRMDGLKGVELLAKIKKIAPYIPVIIMTAYGKIDDAVVSMKEGAFSYLEKPVDAKELKDIIQRAVEISKIEERVGVERELWGKVISRIGAGLVIMDTNGNIKWANKSAYDLMNLMEQLGTPRLPFDEELIKNLVGKGTKGNTEYHDKERGKWFLIATAKRPEGDDVAALILDITELKHAQELLLDQQRLEGIVEMAGAVAHEFSQPLQAILLNCELLRSSASLMDKKPLSRLEKQVEYLGELVHKLTDITRYAKKDYPGTQGIIDIQKAAKG